ncbi:hypothetical protein [Nitrosomonas sp.]|uniref:hypothetical protein n=1 Tax=Nitrosomonas sp. TaxID=42353 RepID=UPI002620A2B3|nr:hypothetical protein [Nitrosomonas sp.]MCW5600035.1 hypothetical protein [Nitrosomonas sp.]
MAKLSVEQSNILIAIDISKDSHDVLLELPDGNSNAFKGGNHKADFDLFASM